MKAKNNYKKITKKYPKKQKLQTANDKEEKII